MVPPTKIHPFFPLFPLLMCCCRVVDALLYFSIF